MALVSASQRFQVYVATLDSKKKPLTSLRHRAGRSAKIWSLYSCERTSWPQDLDKMQALGIDVFLFWCLTKVGRVGWTLRWIDYSLKIVCSSFILRRKATKGTGSFHFSVILCSQRPTRCDCATSMAPLSRCPPTQKVGNWLHASS